MKHLGSRRRRVSLRGFLLLCSILSGLGLLILTLRSIDPSPPSTTEDSTNLQKPDQRFQTDPESIRSNQRPVSCATVEKMGEVFEDELGDENLRVRRMIEHHFSLNGAPRVRDLPPEQFCKHGFVLGKASEAGFGNEMYKILSGAALSIMLNRSLIIGQTRHIGNDCAGKYRRRLIMRTDDFEKPTETNVLCSNWRKWTQPIIWFQGTTDAVAVQFFLKNIHLEMRNAASSLFGQPEFIHSRPNVFGELMRVIVSPSKDVEEAVNWVLKGIDPDITLHTRMLMNRSVRAVHAALNCLKKAMRNHQQHARKPRIVLVSDTPSFIKEITLDLQKFAEVLHFNYKLYEGNISSQLSNGLQQLEFRVKDWGPAPRWVAFVDFFLASRAKHAVVAGAHRRVGTTYAQLIAALAAANQLGDDPTAKFSFFSSFQSNLLSEGLKNQVGWGHVWNRFAGPLSCHNQPNQCAPTPLLPPSWWDGTWQSPIPRDIRRLEAFGVQLSSLGHVDQSRLQSFCTYRKTVIKTARVFHQCYGSSC